MDEDSEELDQVLDSADGEPAGSETDAEDAAPADEDALAEEPEERLSTGSPPSGD